MRKEKRKSLGAVTHTHTHTQDIYKRDRKQANTLVESVYSTESSNLKRENRWEAYPVKFSKQLVPRLGAEAVMLGLSVVKGALEPLLETAEIIELR